MKATHTSSRGRTIGRCLFVAASSALLGLLCVLAPGCPVKIAPRADLAAPEANRNGPAVIGKITYVIDGETKLPYRAFRPAIQRPYVDLLRLEDGTRLQTHGVKADDGSFAWRLEPGHYVISGIGQGQFGDDYRITWPRLAFRVDPGAEPVYLGHLQLIGERYEEPYTLSTGGSYVSKGVRYRYAVVDESDRVELPAGVRPRKSLLFARDDMPIGDQIIDRWRASRDRLTRDIFGG